MSCLAELAGRGRVLEFAIGTGGLALPLAERGLDVHDIELSDDMVARLRAKPGGGALPVVVGDMAEARAPGEFDLVILAFNTITNLRTQAAQVDAFRNAARHLVPGGRFLVEVFVPPLRELPAGQTLRAFARSDTHWGMDEIDPSTQSLISHHFWTVGAETHTLSLPLRYVWPAELDLMARIARLAPVARWGDWTRVPFGPESRRIISVWHLESQAPEHAAASPLTRQRHFL